MIFDEDEHGNVVQFIIKIKFDFPCKGGVVTYSCAGVNCDRNNSYKGNQPNSSYIISSLFNLRRPCLRSPCVERRSKHDLHA